MLQELTDQPSPNQESEDLIVFLFHNAQQMLMEQQSVLRPQVSNAILQEIQYRQ